MIDTDGLFVGDDYPDTGNYQLTQDTANNAETTVISEVDIQKKLLRDR